MKSQEFIIEADLSSASRRRTRLKRDVEPKDQFAWFRFEHADTAALYNALEEQGYDVVGANHNEILIGSLNEKIAKKIQAVIWDDWNDGAWCEYKFVTYDEIEHLL